jgi:CDP-diacylglycerol--glycerol-3-phosphate 3-phosphatidyltransferase
MNPGFNIPIALTWFRIAAIPAVVLVYLLPWQYAHWASALIFTAAGITDGLDGYLARRWNQESRFGALLDPVADKLMVSTALVLVLYHNHTILLMVVAAIIIGREIAISALREWMAELGESSKVAVSGFGKTKTITQMVGLGGMLFTEPFWGIPAFEIGYGLLIISAGLTVWSMFEYLRAAWPQLSDAQNNP